MPNNNDYFNLEGETALRQPLLQAGRITNVNVTTHTYDVETDNKYNLINLPAMYPYVSNEFGQGINFMAEVGTRCIVCNTINGEDFILGWLVPVGSASESSSLSGTTSTTAVVGDSATSEVEQKNADSYVGRSGNRSKDLLPGDIELKSPAENKIRVLNGGVIEIIGSDGECLTQYIPQSGENIIFTKTDILTNILGSGSFEWSTDNTNRTGTMFLEMKSAIDEEPDLFIDAGTILDEEDQRLVIKVGSKDSPSAKISISKLGELTIECKSATINADDDVKVNCKNVTIKAKSKIKMTGTIELN